MDGVLKAMLIDALEVMFVSPKSPIHAVKLLSIKIFPCGDRQRVMKCERSDTHTLDVRVDKWQVMKVIQSGSDVV